MQATGNDDQDLASAAALIMNTKNTFIEIVEDDMAGEKRSASLPTTFKVAVHEAQSSEELGSIPPAAIARSGRRPSTEGATLAGFVDPSYIGNLKEQQCGSEDSTAASLGEPNPALCSTVTAAFASESLYPAFTSENDDTILGEGGRVGLPLTSSSAYRANAPPPVSTVKEGYESLEPLNALASPMKCIPGSPIASPRDDADEGSAPSTPGRRRKGRGRRSRGNYVEFNVTLDKRNGGTHGIDIDWSNGSHLLIEKVNKPGHVASWNAANPDLEICDGNCIVEVNGIRGNAETLLEEMKKDQLLSIVVRRPKQEKAPASPPRSQPAIANLTASSRTALKSNAPLFQPGAPSNSPSEGGPQATDGSWTAPDGMKKEFVEAVQALKIGLSSGVPGGWLLSCNSSVSVTFAGVSLAYATPVVLSGAQQAILSIVAQFPSVFLMGRSTNPFEALGPHGFRLVLASLPKEDMQRVCWDTLGRAFCPRGASCTWKHPTDSDLLEVQIVLQAAEQLAQMPMLPTQ
mmetsp:Transcript_63073/g.150317  ORF Transcript_63073/g.150317 Transcript_63073/m.150317 type:complete len:518 (+) Transcript_63073:146-1699(+)